MGDVLTIRDLREMFGQPQHVLNYALREYGPPPDFRIGPMRFWERRTLPKIRAALQKTAIRSTKAERRKSKNAVA